MEGIIELSEQKCKATVMKMLRALIGKLDSMLERTDSVSREKEIQRIKEKRK